MHKNWNCKILSQFQIEYMFKCNLFLWCKAEFLASFLHYSNNNNNKKKAEVIQCQSGCGDLQYIPCLWPSVCCLISSRQRLSLCTCCSYRPSGLHFPPQHPTEPTGLPLLHVHSELLAPLVNGIKGSENKPTLLIHCIELKQLKTGQNLIMK